MTGHDSHRIQGNSVPTGDIHLERINSSNWRRALEIRTAPGQLRFVAEHEPVALVILSKSFVRHGGFKWEPFALLSDDTMVGIVALAHSGSTCKICHLLIDQSQQGNGLGTTAMRTILDYVIQKLPGCHELTLTVHPDNEHACRLYQSAGFRRTGECRNDEPEWRLEIER